MRSALPKHGFEMPDTILDRLRSGSGTISTAQGRGGAGKQFWAVESLRLRGHPWLPCATTNPPCASSPDDGADPVARRRLRRARLRGLGFTTHIADLESRGCSRFAVSSSPSGRLPDPGQCCCGADEDAVPMRERHRPREARGVRRAARRPRHARPRSLARDGGQTSSTPTTVGARAWRRCSASSISSRAPTAFKPPSWRSPSSAIGLSRMRECGPTRLLRSRAPRQAPPRVGGAAGAG